MSTAERKLRVFLCHASQDKPVVRELYQRLLAEGWIDPWLDEEKLLPGQDWDMEIEKAIKAADVVIVCLSGNSVTKEGYIQTEIKRALNISDRKPDGIIYLIPARLEDCEIPHRLIQWQYVDLFSTNGYEKLHNALVFLGKELGVPIYVINSEIQERVSSLHIAMDRSVYEETRHQLVKLWEREKELISKNYSPDAILYEIFRKAVDIANQALINFPDSPLLKGLVKEAEFKYNTFCRLYEAKSTADQTQDYKRYLDLLFELLDEQGLDKLIPWEYDRGSEWISVSDAIFRVEKNASEFARSKTEEYMSLAMSQLELHNPQVAEDYIRKASSLFMLSSADVNKLNRFYEKRIKPAIESRYNAEQLISSAANSENPENGMKLIDEAREIDPYAPELNEVEDVLRRRLLKRENTN